MKYVQKYVQNQINIKPWFSKSNTKVFNGNAQRVENER